MENELKINHFNKGVIRGSITSFKVLKTKNKISYGDLRIFCPSKEYGDLTVRMRFWGRELASLIDAHKKQPTGKYHFSGDLALLERRGKKILCFNGFRFKPWAPSNDDEPRASFIIEGKVDANHDHFELHHIQEHSLYPKDFVFKFPRIEDGWGVDIHDLVVVYGHFKDIALKYGGSGEIEPMVERVSIKEKKAGSDPF